MTRKAALICLLLGCASSPRPPVSVPYVLDGREPTVRVKIASRGVRDRVLFRADGGVVVDAEGATQRLEGPVTVSREGDLLAVSGTAVRAREVRIAPVTGLLRVDEDLFAGAAVCRAGEGVEVINHVTFENYVLGVLRGELPVGEVPREAAAAQAIAIRSYTLHHLFERREIFDVDDTVAFQRYVGARRAPRDDDLRAGAQMSAGSYLAWQGMPLRAYYHSTCGGHTTDPKTALDRETLPPLAGVPCGYCGDAKYRSWEQEIDAAAIARAARLEGAASSVAIEGRDASGRVLEIVVTAGSGSARLRAGEFRLRVGPSLLRSTLITAITPVPGGFRFAGKGWGHGVGLCQLGAIGMARQGIRAAEILRRYYPGAEMARAY